MNRPRAATLRVSWARLCGVLFTAAAAAALAACNAILDTKDRYLAGTDTTDASLDATATDAAPHDATDATDATEAASPEDAGVDAPSDDASDAADVDSGTADLVAFWTFDEDGGPLAHDGTGHGYDLTVSNQATIGGTGYFGTGALNFPPSTGQATNVALSGAGFPLVGTLSIWGYFMPPPVDMQRNLFDLYDESRHHFYVRYTGANAQANGTQGLDYAMENGANYDFFASPKPLLATGRWTHLVIVWDTTTGPATAQFYLDDMLPAQADVMYSFGSGPLDQTFILYNGFGGSYDDIYLWNRALSAVEVASLPSK